MDPKPASPRVLSPMSSTCTTGSVEHFSRINCATRSPAVTAKSSWPPLIKRTATSPR